MCAIAGIFSVKGNDGTYSLKVKRLLDKMLYRGPDCQSIWVGPHASIGHNRLSITGGKNGIQPIVASEVVVAVNGEFYESDEIRKRYSDKGWEFKTNSDSEILIPLYLEYGFPRLMSKLRGEFAFILYDTKHNYAFAARDRFGIKPLFYRKNQAEGTISFSSEAIAFDGKKFSNTYLCNILSMQYNVKDQSPYDGIYSVMPGNYIMLDMNPNTYESQHFTDYRKFKQRMYYEVPYPFDESPTKSPFPLEKIEYQLLESISCRADCDVPICCHLSGGLDSSTVFGIASTINGSPIPTFSVVFDKNVGKYDETETIKRTIKKYNAESTHHWVNVSQKDILHTFDDAVMAAGGVAINGHISCKYLMNKAIHEAGFKVALTGEGADECFLGYSHFKHDIANVQFDPMMVGSETPYYDKNDSFDQSPGAHFKNGNKYLKCCPTFLEAKFSLGKKLWGLMERKFWRENYVMLNDVDINFIKNAFPLDFKLSSFLEANAKIRASAFLWAKSALPSYILKTLGDGCEMPHSVEGRLPFLDHHLFDMCAQLDVNELYGEDLLEKMPLRRIAKEYVTDEVYSKRKQPFQAPPITMYFDENDWKMVTSKLTSDEFSDLKLFDKYEVVSMLDNVKNGSSAMQTAYEPVVMMLLSINALKNTLG